MKQISKIITLCMVLFVAGAFTLPAQLAPMDAHAATKTKVTISKKKATVIKDMTLQLKIKGTKKKAKWSSSKKSVATVSKKGKVTAKDTGKATITAKIGKKKYKCKVTVKDPTTTLSATSLTLTPGQHYILKVSSNGKSNNVFWWTTHSSVASIDGDGVVTAKKEGTTTITATMNGASAYCEVMVVGADGQDGSQAAGYVWIPTKGGEKYHSVQTCSNMDEPRQVRLEEAKSLGFTQCSKCW